MQAIFTGDHPVRADPGRRLRGHLARGVVADADGLDQVRRLRHAGRQRGRGRGDGPVRPGAADRASSGRRSRRALLTAGVIGVALFFADAMITPAISVLSAVEGVEVAAPSLSSIILPLTIGVLALLFAIQRRGTAAVGRLFGPIIVALVRRDRRRRRRRDPSQSRGPARASRLLTPSSSSPTTR